MVNIAVIDDEKSEIDTLSKYVYRFSEEYGVECTVNAFLNPVKFLDKYKPVYDIVLLDIEMPCMNGMELAERLREIDTSVVIIFVTNMAQYAISGYRVDASDFVVKPVSYFDFAMKFNRIVKRIDSRNNVTLTIKVDGCINRLNIADLRYVEVEGHKLIYHTVNDKIVERGTLKNVEAILLAHGFAKCNNYCLVNMRHVIGFHDYSVRVSFGRNTEKFEDITVSHPRKKEFLRVLNEFWQENM